MMTWKDNDVPMMDDLTELVKEVRETNRLLRDLLSREKIYCRHPKDARCGDCVHAGAERVPGAGTCMAWAEAMGRMAAHSFLDSKEFNYWKFPVKEKTAGKPISCSEAELLGYPTAGGHPVFSNAAVSRSDEE